MAVVRRNFVTDEPSRVRYIEGVKRLKRTFLPGATAGALGILGPAPGEPVSVYDLLVLWHHRAMYSPIPPGSDSFVRNAAHRGSVFLPWHRYFLLVLEQRVLGDQTFGLPYWDWAADGHLPSVQQQMHAAIWDEQALGGFGKPVTIGPFAFNQADPQSWRVRLVGRIDSTIVAANRGLERDPTRQRRLPTKSHVTAALGITAYDTANWDVNSDGFRNRLEGFIGPGMHNRVHVWIGGDMGPSSSPNDPVFYLNHCNVDRIWEAWMDKPEHGRTYLPGMDQPAEILLGQRIDDPLDGPPIITDQDDDPVTPRKLLDPSPWYRYDTLNVA